MKLLLLTDAEIAVLKESCLLRQDDKPKKGTWKHLQSAFDKLKALPEADRKLFTMHISMENDAFQGRRAANELMKMLEHVSGQVATGRFSGKLVDTNGNTVGEFNTVWRQDQTP
jgi:hypothetical protein